MAIIHPSSGKKDIVKGTLLISASRKHQRTYPRLHLKNVFFNWNLELLSSLTTVEPSHASLCPFLIILLVIKTSWHAKLLSWVGVPLINLSSFPGHIILFFFFIRAVSKSTFRYQIHQGGSYVLWICGTYSVVSGVNISSFYSILSGREKKNSELNWQVNQNTNIKPHVRKQAVLPSQQTIQICPSGRSLLIPLVRRAGSGGTKTWLLRAAREDNKSCRRSNAWGPEQQASAVDGIADEGGVKGGGAWVGTWERPTRLGET